MVSVVCLVRSAIQCHCCCTLHQCLRVSCCSVRERGFVNTVSASTLNTLRDAFTFPAQGTQTSIDSHSAPCMKTLGLNIPQCTSTQLMISVHQLDIPYGVCRRLPRSQCCMGACLLVSMLDSLPPASVLSRFSTFSDVAALSFRRWSRGH